MDRSTKILIAVVIVIACLFVVAMLWGAVKHEPTQDKKNPVIPGWVKSGLSELSGSSGSKIKFEAAKFVVAPGQQSQPIPVPAAPNRSDRPRTAKFRRTSGQHVNLTYTDATSDKPKGFEKEQPVEFPAPQDKEPARYKKDPDVGSISALKDGGTMTIDCRNSKVQCVLTLE
jgi:hypothetical protein